MDPPKIKFMSESIFVLVPWPLSEHSSSQLLVSHWQRVNLFKTYFKTESKIEPKFWAGNFE